MEKKDIRWKQRYGNYKDALSFLRESAAKKHFSELEKAGIIQTFEFTFELAWKTIKDYLNEKGVNAIYPKDVIGEAFQSGLIKQGEVWMDMLDSRNLMSHTYQTKDADFVFNEIISNYVSELDELGNTLKRYL